MAKVIEYRQAISSLVLNNLDHLYTISRMVLALAGMVWGINTKQLPTPERSNPRLPTHKGLFNTEPLHK